MRKSTAHILWFKDIRKEDVSLVGGKGANLGEMYHVRIPVPNGFVVSAKTYFDFIKTTSIKEKILTELSGLDMNDSNKLMQASEHIKTAIMAAEMPEKITKEIKKFYHELCGEYDKYVAVRSSATAEDLPDASFAGQQETFLNIKGWEDVAKNVQKAWASLFEPRAIFYRTDRGYDHLKVGIAVPVQLMVQSDVSGIMFTVNPLTNNRNEISIEAAFGLGQPIVSGEITPDQYTVSKLTAQMTHKQILEQKWQLTLGGKTPISKAYQKRQKLNDKKIIELAKIGMQIEEHYGRPQDIEWGMEDGILYIVQSRPVTTLIKDETKVITQVDKDQAGKFVLEGLGASPGVASGNVRILKSAKEIDKVKEGEVLVAEMTNPDFVPAMKRACAIVTDKGGRTSHAAIVSRELGIPAVVGSVNATSVLTELELITVDGSDGRIYEGDFVISKEVETKDTSKMKTATKIYVNLAEPELAGDMAQRNVDGIGLLRAEFMIANIGNHPRWYIENKKQKEFIEKLSEGIEKFAFPFYPRPVIYRTTDFRTNEFRGLKGGEKYEGEEENPMIGFRGASRYIEDADVFKMEVEAIKDVRNKKGLKNLHVMIPFVRTLDELSEVKKLLSANGLRRSGSFKLWMMAEVPSNVILLDEFIEIGIDGISIGSNDLTMLTLGVDRDNERVANVYNELDPAVLASLEKIVKTCKKHGVTCSICGQAPSEYPELVEMLTNWGITSVSIAPDVLEKTRINVYEAEKKLLSGNSSKNNKKRRKSSERNTTKFTNAKKSVKKSSKKESITTIAPDLPKKKKRATSKKTVKKTKKSKRK
jgi:pyruvate, water dikinase